MKDFFVSPSNYVISANDLENFSINLFFKKYNFWIKKEKIEIFNHLKIQIETLSINLNLQNNSFNQEQCLIILIFEIFSRLKDHSISESKNDSYDYNEIKEALLEIFKEIDAE